jgi:hypothetical protein
MLEEYDQIFDVSPFPWTCFSLQASYIWLSWILIQQLPFLGYWRRFILFRCLYRVWHWQGIFNRQWHTWRWRFLWFWWRWRRRRFEWWY